MTLLAILLGLGLLAALAAIRVGRKRELATAREHDLEKKEERARHEAAVRTEATRSAAVFDRMVDGIIIVGEDGQIRLANRAAAGLFTLTAPVVGRTLLEATRHHEVAAVAQKLDSQPEVLEHELRLERAGEVRVLQISALALLDANGARDGALLVFHDVTRLQQLEAIRQDFVANVSHELRTPLSLIKSAAETLIDGGKLDAAVTARFLEIIDKHANRLTLLIDDLLLLARLDSGRLDLQLQPLSLRRAAGDAFDDAAILARGREITLRNDVPPDIVALADPDRLRQVLANLIDNAIKYGRTQGQVTLTARSLEGVRIEVSVHDDGPGIPADAQARIFERFYRVDKARAREQGGTGLGLAIVKNVVEAHGGDVRVESSAEEGTTFHFTLRAGPAGTPPGEGKS